MSVKEEVELRLQLVESEAAKLLELVRAQPSVQETHQLDLYFDTADRTWTSTDPVRRWLRMRTTNRGAQINLKTFTYSAGGDTTGAEEVEFEINDADAGLHFLQTLGYEQVVSVSKVRVSAQFDGIEVAVDRVENLGLYAEIEALDLTGTYNEILESLKKFVTSLGIEVRTTDKRGYPYALLKKRAAK